MGRRVLDAVSTRRMNEMAAMAKQHSVIAEELGVSQQTVSRNLAKPENLAAVAEIKEALAVKCDAVANSALDLIDPVRLQKSSASQLAVIAGIMVEKSALLRGNRTSAPVVNIVIGDPSRPISVEATVTEGDSRTIEIEPETA